VFIFLAYLSQLAGKKGTNRNVARSSAAELQKHKRQNKAMEEKLEEVPIQEGAPVQAQAAPNPQLVIYQHDALKRTI